jgi:hypothetical protein
MSFFPRTVRDWNALPPDKASLDTLLFNKPPRLLLSFNLFLTYPDARHVGIGISMILGLGIGANNTANVCGVVYGTKSMSFRKINVILLITRVIGTLIMR